MVIDDILSDVGVGGTAGDNHSSSSVIVIDVGECRLLLVNFPTLEL